MPAMGHEPVSRFLASFWSVALDAAPWLVLGFAIAGLIRALLPMRLVTRWLGGGGVGPVVRAAIVGTPLPLCSCSVVPVALSIRRSGASKGATASFLIATPENGVDSMLLSWGVLGPAMMLARVVGALACAIVAGVSADAVDKDDALTSTRSATCGCASRAAEVLSPALTRRVIEGLRYAFTDMWKRTAGWMLLGLILAAAVQAFVPPGTLASWGRGPLAMVVMALVGVPMYVCASASTPLAAALVTAGVSPGAALVFLLSGPGTNLGTVAIVRRELGPRTTWAYLAAVTILPIVLGLALDAILARTGVQITPAAAGHASHVPDWVQIPSLAILVVAVSAAFLRPRSHPGDHMPTEGGKTISLSVLQR